MDQSVSEERLGLDAENGRFHSWKSNGHPQIPQNDLRWTMEH